MENDRILDLSDQEFFDRIYDSVKDAYSYDGKTYAYPMCLEMLGIYYNVDLFEEAGITEVPKTFEQMEEACFPIYCLYNGVKTLAFRPTP